MATDTFSLALPLFRAWGPGNSLTCHIINRLVQQRHGLGRPDHVSGGGVMLVPFDPDAEPRTGAEPEAWTRV
jgi:hypothetical protein